MTNETVVTKISHKFSKCKAGALMRFQRQAAEVMKAWNADIATITEAVENEGLKRSNMALYKTKTDRALGGAEAEAKQVMEMVQNDYRIELYRLMQQFGGELDGNVVTFPDGSTASMPKKLFLKEERLHNLLK